MIKSKIKVIMVRIRLLIEDQENIYSAATQGFAFNNEIQSTEAPQVEIEPQRPLKPVITNYENGDQVSSNGFILEGKTKPNAMVEVKVASKVSVLDGFINVDLGSETFFEDTVKADKLGNFVVTIPALGKLVPGMKYNVTAIASNQQNTSNPTELTLTQK